MNGRQAALTTVFCTKTKPPPNCADADCIAYCDSTGYPYLCKSGNESPELPAREWICSHLAKYCGLPVANCTTVSIDGRSDILFGSEWQSGTKEYYKIFDDIDNSHVFSGTLAFDFASNNIDRHMENYLYLEVQGKILIKLIDFSRAFDFCGWPMPSLPFEVTAHTSKDYYTWSKKYPLIKSEAEKIIKKWNSLPNDIMGFILDQMPTEWMSNEDRQKYVEWWSSDARIQRGNDAIGNLP